MVGCPACLLQKRPQAREQVAVSGETLTLLMTCFCNERKLGHGQGSMPGRWVLSLLQAALCNSQLGRD